MAKKIKKFISFFITLIICLYFYVLQPISKVEAAPGITKFEQQINISNGEFSTTNTTDSPADNSLGLINIDSSQFDGGTIYFEALLKCDTCSGGNNASAATLYSDSGSPITSVSTQNDFYTLVRSGSIAVSADDYTVRFKLDATAGTAYIKAARIIVSQTNTSGISDTQTQIEVGHYESATATSATQITSPKFYVYDDSKFSGTKNAYFEATLKTSGSSTTATYYFDNYDSGGEEWIANPSYMTDNNTSNYASTATDADVHLLNSNTNTSTDLGTITKVEVRAYTYQDNDTTGSLTLRPVFSGSSDGDNHNITPPLDVGAWSAYQDITNDTNAPSSWAWSDVQGLDFDAVWNQNASSNTGFVSKVEVQVTYEDNTIIAYAELYNTTNSTIVDTVSTSSESYQRVRSSALSSNWDTTNPDQYVVRIYTSNGGNTAYISNAKIIIDQTETGGISKLELAHQYITTTRTQTNTSYTQDSFLNDYTPGNFNTPHTRKVYFDATIKTSAGTGYAMLYNVSDTDSIDTATTSEVTTTSTNFEQQISGDLSDNSDWPTTTKRLDTILKASTSNTTSVSSTRLLIEIANLDPSFTLTVTGVSSGQTHNSITTTVTTTVTEVDFGSITPGTPAYAAQEVSVSTNDANASYVILARLSNTMQGLYPGNNIDPFIGSSATWADPQNWLEPTGSTKNSDTGWLGGNTTDTSITGWSSGDNKFGPISTSDVVILQSTSGANKTEYITYGLEVNAAQPADQYSGSLVYTAVPVY